MEFFNRYRDLFQADTQQQANNFHSRSLILPEHSLVSSAQKYHKADLNHSLQLPSPPCPQDQIYSVRTKRKELPPILPGYKTPVKKNHRDMLGNKNDQNYEPLGLKKLKKYSQEKPSFAPLLPAYQQSRSLGRKISQMKRDYQQFDTYLQRDPKTHRKSRANPEDAQNGLWKSAEVELKREKQENYPLEKRRTNWLKEDQKHLFKHSELHHLFKEQIKEDNFPKLKKIKESIVPRPLNFISPMQMNYEINEPLQIFRPRHKMEARPSVNSHSLPPERARSIKKDEQEEAELSEAQKRRKFAKMNIMRRRDRLSYLLRTSW